MHYRPLERLHNPTTPNAHNHHHASAGAPGVAQPQPSSPPSTSSGSAGAPAPSAAMMGQRRVISAWVAGSGQVAGRTASHGTASCGVP